MSSLQDLAAEYGVDVFEHDDNELENEYTVDWVNEDLHGFLATGIDYPNFGPGTRSPHVTRSSRA
jgi:hypothetical protein